MQLGIFQSDTEREKNQVLPVTPRVTRGLRRCSG